MKKEIKTIISVITLVVAIMMLFVINISAMKPLPINEQIICAQKKLETAEAELSTKNLELFLTYKHSLYPEITFRAETKLRERYPKEYWEYIKARTSLDDLRYMQFLMLANGAIK